jgi:hypothetical protein
MRLNGNREIAVEVQPLGDWSARNYCSQELVDQIRRSPEVSVREAEALQQVAQALRDAPGTWLDCSHDGDHVGEVVQVEIEPDGLSPGYYWGGILVELPESFNIIPVRLRVALDAEEDLREEAEDQ